MELLFFHVEWSSYSHSHFVPVFFSTLFFPEKFPFLHFSRTLLG